jgi:hypothetical protein
MTNKKAIEQTLSLTKLQADELAKRIEYLTTLIFDLRKKASTQLDVTVHPSVQTAGEKLVILHHTAEAHKHFLEPVDSKIRGIYERLYKLENPPKKTRKRKKRKAKKHA